MTVVEDIQANVKSELALIVAGATSTSGYTYVYTPKVARVDVYRESDIDGATEPAYPLYLVRDTGDETSMEPERFGDLARRLTVPILACKQDQRSETNPFRTTIDAGSIRNDLVGDVKAKLAEDDLRGLTKEFGINTEFPRIERSYFKDGWVLAEIIVLVTFRHARDKP